MTTAAAASRRPDAPDRAPHVLVVVGTPLPDSLVQSLARSYAQAIETRAEVRTIDLSLQPVPAHPANRTDVRVAPGQQQSFGPAIDGYIADVLWADHIAIVYPQWWGTYPAALKAFFDRVFVAGSAFRYLGGRRWEKLLSGRTARIVMTMDSPRFWNRLSYRNASEISIKNAILGYCGVKTLGITRLAEVRRTDETTRERWVRDMANLGRHDARRIRPRATSSDGRPGEPPTSPVPTHHEAADYPLLRPSA